MAQAAVPTIRLGCIGAGGYSRRVLLPNFKKIPGVELVVVANSKPETTAKVAGEFGFARSVADWRAVVDAKDIDAIVVGTRTEAHYEMIPPILEAGSRWFGRHTRLFGYRRGYDVQGATVPARPGRGEVRPETNIAMAELADGGIITYQHSTVAGDTARAL